MLETTQVLFRSAVALVLCWSCCTTFVQADDGLPAEFKIVELEYADSVALSKLLSRLFPDDGLIIAMDQRTNSIVLRGSADPLAMAERIVAALDQPAKHPPRPPSDKRAPTEPNTARVRVRARKESTARSPASGVVRAPVNRRVPVKRGDVLATIEEDRIVDEQSRLRQAMSAAAAKNRQAALAREHLELLGQLQAERHALQLAEQRLSTARAKIEVQQVELETELANAEAHFQALGTRVKATADRAAAGGDGLEEIAMVRAEAESARRSIGVIAQRMQLHKTHVGPLAIAQHEIEVSDVKRSIERLNRAEGDLKRRMEAEKAAVETRAALLKDRGRRVSQRDSRVVSPKDGTARRQMNVRDGAVVRENQQLFRIESTPE